LVGYRLFFCFDHSATDGKVLKSYCWIFNIWVLTNIRKENSKFNRKRCLKNVRLVLFSHRFAELTGLNLPFSGKFLRDAASKSVLTFGEKNFDKIVKFKLWEMEVGRYCCLN
jgi:hypothetical protein